jgi:acetyl-CoA acetyltransferase family protein
MKEAVIIDACRTAYGKARPDGMFFKTRAEDLSLAVIKALVERNPQIDVNEIEDVRWGCSAAQHEQGSNLARRLVLMSGLPQSVGGSTMVRYCASSLETIATAAHAIQSNAGDIFIAGGVEHQSTWDYEWFANGHYPNFYKVCNVDPAMDNMGLTAENLLEMEEYTISRTDLDTFAMQSQQKAGAAIAAGKFQDMIVPLKAELADGSFKLCDTDEGPRPGVTLEKLASLKPAFKKGGMVTAGNCCGLNDGAAGVIVMSLDKAKELGIQSGIKTVSTAIAGVKPEIMGIGPVPATQKALHRAGLSIDDMDVIEINEAFAAQVLASCQDLGIDPQKINKWGGAIAFGHPEGSSGARLISFLFHQMKEDPDLRYGLATMCVGQGQGAAIIVENLNFRRNS